MFGLNWSRRHLLAYVTMRTVKLFEELSCILHRLSLLGFQRRLTTFENTFNFRTVHITFREYLQLSDRTFNLEKTQIFRKIKIQKHLNCRKKLLPFGITCISRKRTSHPSIKTKISPYAGIVPQNVANV